jgi:CBS domain-containing protein
MKVREIMSTRPALIDPSTTIAEAARTMRESDLGCLLIGQDEQVFGIVTDRDIVVRALANGTNATRERVCDVMSSEVLSCFEDQPVENVAKIMAEHGFRRRVEEEQALCSDLLQEPDRRSRDTARVTDQDGLRRRGRRRG